MNPAGQDPARAAVLECLLQEQLESLLGARKVLSVRVVRTRACPLCAEPVKDTALVCPHCRSLLDPALARQDFWWFAGKLLGGLFAIAFAGSLVFALSLAMLALVKR